jgi:organic radical activating enzyme
MNEKTAEYLSCRDLQSSVYLAPTQVRACCQRFFLNGVQQGDVVLLDIEKGDTVTSETIYHSKQNLIKLINNNKPNPCTGCPYIEKKHWDKNESLTIKHLSLEYHSICNLKCTYCSEEYFGGKNVQYDLHELLNTWSKNLVLDGCDSIVWGGGEPTLDPRFKEMLDLVLVKIKPKYLRFFTNSVKYSDEIQNLLDSKRIYITTSIDAGTKKTYDLIRGYDRFEKVFTNLSRYAQFNPNHLTIKYIFTSENHHEEELVQFLSKIEENKLTHCNFQISFDFTQEFISQNIMQSIIFLYSRLIDLKVPSIFIDDLIWQRISKKLNLNDDLLISLKVANLEKYIASTDLYPEVIVWGTGTIAANIATKASFFQKSKIVNFVTNDRHVLEKGYKTINGVDIPVFPTSSLKESSLPIFAAAAQQNPLIIEEMHRLNISSKRLIRALII